MPTVSYVYGIVPADVQATADARGVGAPASKVSVIRHGDIAALVSEIDSESPLGSPQDLAAHAGLLDSAAADSPVLPLRFGAVLTDPQAVAEELLAAHHDEFKAALRDVHGKAEYIVRGRYDELTVLTEVLADDPQAQRLRESIRDKGQDAARPERIALGERVSEAVVAKREADTRTVVDTLQELGLECVVREPTHELDAVHVACLAETAKQSELEQAVTGVAREWTGRVNVRLLGPLAAYDFVVTPERA